MSNVFPTSQPVSLRLKIVKFTELQAPRPQSGVAVKVQMESLVPDFSKITKAERIEEMVLIHVWPYGTKALPDTNSYFFRQGLLLK
jgi:hypothetical protein